MVGCSHHGFVVTRSRIGRRTALEDNLGTYELLALTGLGIFTGAYGVLIGAGVGFVLAPLLMLVWGLDPVIAVGTSLAVVLVTSISGSIRYAFSRTIDYRSGLLFAGAALPGSILGAIIAAKTPGSLLMLVFGVFLIGMSAFTVCKPPITGTSTEATQPNSRSGRTRSVTTAAGITYIYTFSEPWAIACNCVFGFLSSLFGVGGGLIRVPILVFGFRFPVVIAAATSIFSMGLYTGIGVITHGMLGNLHWNAFVFASIGAIIGTQIGAPMAPRLQGRLILRMLAAGLATSGVWLVFRGSHIL
jgi:uncharacterized membrane protein YfcA